MKKRTPITAAELTAKLLADPEYIVRRKEKERRLAERSARLQAEQEPILAELRGVGWYVKSVWDLVNTATKYEEAIPILIKHLLLPYSDVTRGGIARALAIREARFAWAILVDQFCNEPLPAAEGQGLGAKDGLAVALAATATDAVMDELVMLAKDRSHGESRLLLLPALKKSKTLAAKQALDELAFDPDLMKEIASWKRSKSRKTEMH